MVGNSLQVLFYSQLFSVFSIAALLAPSALVIMHIGNNNNNDNYY